MLPDKYEYLIAPDSPRMILKAAELYGTKEIVGAQHSPIILGWAKELHLENVYKKDEIPWCGLFMLVVAVRASKMSDLPWMPAQYEKALWAQNWAHFGKPAVAAGIKADGTVSLSQMIEGAMLGDICVFKRPEGGHVGLYVGEYKEAFWVLGGNQGNNVSIARVAKARCIAVRRPLYTVIPSTVRKIWMTPEGNLSSNEA